MTDKEWMREARKLQRYIKAAKRAAKDAQTMVERISYQREVKHWEEKLRVHRLPTPEGVSA